MSSSSKKSKSFNSKFSKGKSKNNDLVSIYYDTKQYFRNMKLGQKSILYDISNIDFDLPDVNYQCDCQVVNQDTLDTALELRSEGLYPLVLNMASRFKPGGGVENGRTAQEEVIFRRTNAFMTHYPDWYPLSNYGVIYSPEVTIIKDNNYKLIKEHQCISMLAVHAIKDPKIVQGTYTENDQQLMELKIESIFKLAIKHGHDSLVLGALGCGAYNNPVHSVISIFKCYLPQYIKYFKKIRFAILSIRDDNFTLFSQAFN